VQKYSTTTALTASPNPSYHGQLVTFTATVTASGPYPLTGTVKFWDGATAIGSVKLNGGVAMLKKSTLAVGTHAITAQYLSDSYNAKSTFNEVDQVVQ
jgi:Big-like domain-containing protein